MGRRRWSGADRAWGPTPSRPAVVGAEKFPAAMRVLFTSARGADTDWLHSTAGLYLCARDIAAVSSFVFKCNYNLNLHKNSNTTHGKEKFDIKF